MMLLTKLKAVAVAVLLAVGGGLGALPVLAAAADPTGRQASNARSGLGPNLTDEEFLRRVCLDLRGTRPSDVEVRYFVADADPAKRAKVVRWLTEPGDVNLEARLRIDFTNLVAETRDIPYRLTDVKGHIELPVAGQPGLQVNRFARLEPQAAQAREGGALVTEFADFDAPRQGGWFGLTFADEPRVWSVELQDNQPSNPNVIEWRVEQPNAGFWVHLDESDEQFLTRVCQDVRGGPPTVIEKEYFLADQDPDKRQKLLDTFLKDPEVAKKLGAEWKKKLLGTADRLRLHYKLYQRQRTGAYRLWLKTAEARPDRFEALLGQLLDGQRTDDQVLDALCAAVVGRLPTESERKLILATVAKGQDKAAVWREVIATLGGTEEAKKHAEKK